MSAQELHELMSAGDVVVGLTTVYRTLRSMAERAEIDVIQADNGEAMYRRCNSGGHHHHLVCTRCRKTVEVEAEVVERWANEVAGYHGFTPVKHTVELYGLCSECRPAE